VPSPESLDAAVTELLVVLALRVLLPFVAAVLILSLGRQGMDVLFLRALLTCFLMGATIVALILWAIFSLPIPLPIEPRLPGPFEVILGGLLVATLLGPTVTFVAALANLLWYRSLRSLRAQLGLISRLVLALFLVANLLYSAWAFARVHNLGSSVLFMLPAAATLAMMVLVRKAEEGSLTQT
jgi:hypothetical protein